MKIMRGLVFALLFSAGVLSSAQDPDFSYIKKVNGKVIIPPAKSKPVVIPKFKFAPVIDGILDDPVWKEAAIFFIFNSLRRINSRFKFWIEETSPGIAASHLELYDLLRVYFVSPIQTQKQVFLLWK